jgi:alkaline phosphatase D
MPLGIYGQRTTTIAFGSCGHETKPQPILQKVADIKPDFFIYLGDNIYGDTYDMDVLKAKYKKLGEKPEYQSLQRSTKVLATWDDHDYGWNDIGRHYQFKEQSKEIFLEFFKEPINSEKRKRPGIYDAHIYQYGDKILQIILLDTRTFRDDLRTYRGELHDQNKYFYPLDYYPHQIEDSTLLGKEQWTWLEKELTKPADVRLICSSTQFSIEFNGYEAWANFPHEQARMVELINKTKANGVVFISGDVHYAEISKLNNIKGYPIYDFTSSGITSTWHFATPNINRIEGPVMENHYGLITIDWMSKQSPTIKMECVDINDNQRFEYTLSLSQLKFK